MYLRICLHNIMFLWKYVYKFQPNVGNISTLIIDFWMEYE